MANYSTLKYQSTLALVDSDYIQARLGDLIDSIDVISLIDSNYINSRVEVGIDSASIITLIDSDYINSRVTFTFDSADVTPIIITTVDSDYVRARQDFRYGSLTGRPVISSTDDSTSDTLYYPYMVDSTGENAFLNPIISTGKLYFQPSTGELTATSFNSLSDVSYKEDISPITNVFDILENVNPVKFNWKNNGKKSYGVIAQELEEIIPELVATRKGVKTVQYTPLIALLIEAIKELKKQIDNK